MESLKTQLLALKGRPGHEGRRLKTPGRSTPSTSGANPTHRTVNGLVKPKITIRPRETQLWRFVERVRGDLVPDRPRRRVTSTTRASHCRSVAQDANSRRRPVRKTSFLMAPGQRFDVLVQGARDGQLGC